MNKLKIKNAVVILGCPRSGTSLLFRILSTSPYLWSLYREANDIWSNFYKISHKEFKDDLLTESDLNEALKFFLLNEFHKHSLNNYYLGYLIREYLQKRKELNWATNFITFPNFLYKKAFLKDYRIVEKTPKNCFRIPFINSLFDNCKFIFLKRDARSNINSLIEGWRTGGKFIREEVTNISLNIKGYNGTKWKYVMPPEWENYTSKSLEEVSAFQWVSSNKAALDGLKVIENNRKFTTSYEELTENTYETIKKICSFIDIPFSKELEKISSDLPLVNFVTKPNKEKWRKNYDLIKNTYPMIEPMMKTLGYGLL